MKDLFFFDSSHSTIKSTQHDSKKFSIDDNTKELIRRHHSISVDESPYADIIDMLEYTLFDIRKNFSKDSSDFKKFAEDINQTYIEPPLPNWILDSLINSVNFFYKDNYFKNKHAKTMQDTFALYGQDYIRLKDGEIFSGTVKNTTLGSKEEREWLKKYGYTLSKYAPPQFVKRDAIEYDDSINIFIDYFNGIFNNNEKLINATCAAFIYAMNEDAKKTRFNLHLIGPPKTGKSTLFYILEAVCGHKGKYTLETTFDGIARSSINLDSKILVLVEEVPQYSKNLTPETLKRMLSQTQLEAKALYKNSHNIYNKAFYIFTSNEYPASIDNALLSRLISVEVTPHDVDYTEIYNLIENEKVLKMLIFWMEERAELFSEGKKGNELIAKLNNYADEYYAQDMQKDENNMTRGQAITLLINDEIVNIGTPYTREQIGEMFRDLNVYYHQRHVITAQDMLYTDYYIENRVGKIHNRRVREIIFHRKSKT